MTAELIANSPTPGSVVPITTLAAPIATTGATTITVAAPAPTALQGAGQFRIVIDSEIMLVTAGATGTSWTVTRAVEGPVAATHGSGASVFHYLTAGALTNLIATSSDALGAASTAVSGVVAATDPLGDRAYSDNSPHMGTQVGKLALDGSGNLVITIASNGVGVDTATGSPYFNPGNVVSGEEALLLAAQVGDGTVAFVINTVPGLVAS
jgi:hypothetical protein